MIGVGSGGATRASGATLRLVTVGISLLDKLRHHEAWNDSSREVLRDDPADPCLERCVRQALCLLACKPALAPQAALSRRCGGAGADPYPAELSSLFLALCGAMDQVPESHPGVAVGCGTGADRLILLHPSSGKGKWCAWLAEQYCRNQLGAFLGSVRSVPIEGLALDTADVAAFGMALTRLANVIADEIEQWRKGAATRVVLDVTGGFKATIPYVTGIAACFPDVQVIALFENAAAHVQVPALPVDADIAKWRDFRGVLRLFERNGGTIEVARSLPPRLQGLCDSPGLSVFGQAFERRFRDEQEGLALTPYGKGRAASLLLDAVGTPTDSPCRDLFNRLLPRWQHLWLGDRVPEMAEHARGHTQRLQEFALQILLPLLADGGIALSSRQAFLLLAGIWLHDTGHAGDVVEYRGSSYRIARFPQLMRDAHSLLTYTMLGDRGYRTMVLEGVADGDIEAIREISLRHRQKVPLVTGESWWFLDAIEVAPYAGCDEEMILPAALLRLCDACDVQAERAGDGSFRKMRRFQACAEARRLLEQVLPKGRTLDECFRDLLGSRVTLLADSVRCLLDWLDSDPPDDSIPPSCLHELKSIVDSVVVKRVRATRGEQTGAEQEAVDAWLSGLSRGLFLLSQLGHYAKHASIEAVVVLRGEGLAPDKPHLVAQVIPTDESIPGADSPSKVATALAEEFSCVRDLVPFTFQAQVVKP